ncbi:hypothetical protein OAF65_02380 [Verrucomicrobiales bacterium]|jgi:hypothetical protein|nr:hypothetical protein [Verrucomicrobiales bacterium]NCG27350.1 hypothetical protein [Verrucomicrobiales bacterium]|tara:strand:- start:1114 stop:1389 length:276 start_codon:yes stop_codon:yes gene_type:complete
MKSAYELAMERLEKESPQESLTEEQKKLISEIEKKCSAKIAEREVFLRSKIKESLSEGQFEEAEQIEDELSRELKSLRMRCESEKEEVRGN